MKIKILREKWKWRWSWSVRSTLVLCLTGFFLISIYAEVVSKEIAPENEKISLTEALYRISIEYQVFFSYDQEAVQDIEVNYEPDRYQNVEHALDRMLKGTSLHYRIFNNRYIILYESSPEAINSLKDMVQHLESVIDKEEKTPLRRSAPALSALPVRNKSFSVQPVAFSVSGIVTDQEGEPLIGVNIQVKGSNKGTATDFDGKFILEDIDENAILVISYVGYQTQEMPVAGKSSLEIVMMSDAELLDEVVVVGYGTQKKVNVTGSVDIISEEKIASRPASNVSQLLQGTSPSLDLSINNNYGFQPGAEMDITIRGMGSLNGGSPYILIDGVPGDINLINPEDIKSISVLKDAAASAIYGARAPYGVILITTKEGKRNEIISVNYSANLLINTPMPLPTMPDSYTWARILNEAGANAGGMPISETTIDRMIAYQNEDWNYLRESMPDWPDGATNFGAYPEGNVWNGANLNYGNTNWWDVYFGNSVNPKHNLSISGGGEKSSYYLSAGYLKQNSVLEYGTDYFDRINVKGKFEFAISDWWDVGYEPRFAKTIRERPNMTQRESGDYDHMLRHILRAYPWTPLFNGWGSPSEGGDYMSESHIPSVLAGTDKDDIKDFWNIFRTEIRLSKNLKINADFSYNNYTRSFTEVDKTAFIQNVDKTYAPFGTTVPSQYTQTDFNNNYWTTNFYASYNLDLKDVHNLLFLVGGQLEKGKNVQLSGYKTDLIYQDIPSLRTATGDPIVNQFLSHRA